MKWCVVKLRYGLIFKEAGNVYYLIIKMLQNSDKLVALHYFLGDSDVGRK